MATATKYLKMTDDLYAEYLASRKYNPTTRADFDLPNGSKNASRLIRRNDKLIEEAPWLLADIFSIPARR